MRCHHTVLAQLLKVLPRPEFEALARRHQRGRKLRRMTRWSQFLALSVAQLAGRTSLRDIVLNLQAQAHRLCSLGCERIARSSLARVNEQQPHTLYEEVFAKLLAKCQATAPQHRFRFQAPLFSLDATMIDLSLSVFPWASYQATKGAIKLHVGLDHCGDLPAFVTVTEGKVYELQWARTLELPAKSIVVFDRGFNDYLWYGQLKRRGIDFVTRLKKDTSYRVVERRSVCRQQGITSDQTIYLKSSKRRDYPFALRRIGYQDPQTGKHYVFLTTAFHLAAKTIAEIYRERWKIELFFKWIKQNLRIKSFLGTSRNAVLTQIWVALCMYLLLAYLRFRCQIGLSLQQMLRLLQLNLFERRDLLALLRASPPPPKMPEAQYRLQFA